MNPEQAEDLAINVMALILSSKTLLLLITLIWLGMKTPGLVIIL